MLFSSICDSVSFGWPLTVTRPFWVGCLNCLWLPSYATRYHPSFCSILKTSVTFVTSHIKSNFVPQRYMIIYQCAIMLYKFISKYGNSIMSKSSFVVGAAGLEPALLAKARLTRQRSRMSNNINVLPCIPVLIPIQGYTPILRRRSP